MLKSKAENKFSPPNNQNKERGAIFIPILIIAAIGYFAAPAFLSTASKDFGMVISSMIVALSRSIFYIVSDLSSGMITRMLRPEWKIINDNFFSPGWVIVRDVANLFIVLALIAIAIATILRFKDYEAKKLLPYLIAVALLVNFSGVVCGIIIDASNILMGGFNNGDYVAKTMYDRLLQGEHDTLDPLYTDSDKFLEYTAAAAAYILAYLVLSFAFLMYSILLLVRYVMLGILYILSPMAFVLWIIPKTRSYSTKWFTNFIQWAFLGAMAAFFINLASQVLSKFSGAGTVAVFTIAILVIVGLRMSYKTSAIGAGLAIGAVAAVATGGAALGWKGLKQMGKETGVSGTMRRAKEAIADRATQLGEKVGYYRPGTRQLQQQERLQKDKSAERMAALPPEERQKIATGPAFTEAAKNDKVAAVKHMAEKGELKNLTTGQRKDVMEYGTYHGLSVKDFVKTDPTLERFNKPAVDEQKKGLVGKMSGVIDPKTGLDIGRYRLDDMNNPKSSLYAHMNEQAESAAVRQAVQKAQPYNVRDYSHETFADPDVQMALDVSKIKAIGKGGSQKAKETIKNTFKTTAGRNALMGEITKRGLTTSSPEFKQMVAIVKHLDADTSGDF